jgi:hypothetical protein
MSIWLWILVGIVILILFAVLWLVVMDRLEIRRLMKDPVYQQGLDAMIASTKAETQGRSVRTKGPGSRSMHAGIPELVRANNVSGLLRLFSLADGWETRESVVVALGNVCRDANEGTDYEGPEMVSALQSIIELCKAESSGGSYRENCIDHSEMLLKRFQ